MNLLTKSFQTPRGLLLNIMACEIIGAICLVAVFLVQFNMQEVAEIATFDQIRVGVLSLGALSILFTVVATRILRARLENIRQATL